MASQNQDMLNACMSGDVATLQRLFEARGIRKGSKAVSVFSPNNPPPINHLLEAAITNGNPSIVCLLLETYEWISFGGNVITALLNHPDLANLEALYNHDNRIVNYEWDSQGVTTFVTEACKQPPEKIVPLLHFLVEHDASLDVGGFRFQFAVHAALCGNQPLDVIEAMIKKSGPVYPQAAEMAILRERADVLELFIRFGVGEDIGDVQHLRTVAKETRNTNVMKLVDTWTSKREGDKNRVVSGRGQSGRDSFGRALVGRDLFGRALVGRDPAGRALFSRGFKFGSIWRRILG